ncbi:MAG: ketohydroxyglutarate aldolase [Actinomycetota bacterium]|nr:ketohydroxyglutarate aldolase [Actinomycetota bacterium]
MIVTAADEAMGHLDDLADRLRTAGMDVERVLGMGVITGSVPLERRAALVEVDGVAGVEDERTFSTPPPPSDIQ